jgi:hypothetical protein
MKNERLMAMEAMLGAGERKKALVYLSEYLKTEGALRLASEVERASRGSVGGFSLDDILALAPLSEEQGEAVMERLADEFDPELGMNWEQVKETIESLFERVWDFTPPAEPAEV